MDSDERKKIRQYSLTNTDLRRLYMEHLNFERKLASLEGSCYLTAEEQMMKQTIKKQKLYGKDAMLRMVAHLSGTA